MKISAMHDVGPNWLYRAEDESSVYTYSVEITGDVGWLRYTCPVGGSTIQLSTTRETEDEGRLLTDEELVIVLGDAAREAEEKLTW